MQTSHPTRREFLHTAAGGLAGLALSASDTPGLAQGADAARPGEGPPADDPASWAQFLGPRRDAVSRETGLNTDWANRPPRTLWQVPLGAGFSSVAIAGGRLYSMCKRGDRDGAVCLDLASGKEIWFHDAAPSYLDRQRHGPGPRATPTFHRGRLYCLFPMGELLCLNAADGKELWKTNLFTATGARNPHGEVYYWGMSGSPLVEGDAVIVQPGGNRNNSLVAFHKDTGRQLWGVGNDPPGYSSPIVVTAAGRRHVVAATGQALLAVDPATGTLLWRYVFGNKFDCNCTVPLWINDMLFYSAAYGTGSVALEIAATGAGLAVKEKWRNRTLQILFSTGIVAAGHLFACHGDIGATMLRCIDLATGESKWDDRRTGRCSLLGFDGYLVVISERGTIRLIEANPERFVGKGEINGLLSYKAWAQPALIGRRLYVRDDKQLVCLDMSRT